MNNTRSLVYLWLDIFVRSMFVCMICLLWCNYGNKFELFSTNNSFLMYQLTNTAALTFVPNFLDRALTFNDGWYFLFLFSWFIGKDSSQNLCVLYTHFFIIDFFCFCFIFFELIFCPFLVVFSRKNWNTCTYGRRRLLSIHLCCAFLLSH